MDKIYRRPTQTKGSHKRKKDEKNRVRNTIMNFRVSPKEKSLIEARIAMTGLSKSDYFIESCLYQKILVKGNIKSFSEIKGMLSDIANDIKLNPNLEEIDDTKAECLRVILEMMFYLFGKGER